MFVDYDKVYQIIVKQARNKKNPSDVFLISFYFAEDLATIKSILENSLIGNSNSLSQSLRM